METHNKLQESSEIQREMDTNRKKLVLQADVT